MIKGIAPDVPITSLFRGTFPFLVVLVVLLGGFLAFPDLVARLPLRLNP